MRFISTRGKSGKVSAAEAIIKGLADDGGLFVPEYFPKVFQKLKEKASISYEELSFEIIKEFFDDIPEEDLKEAIDEAYKGRFEILEKGAFLELYHGPTSAFKDVALLFLPQIMKKAKKVLAINDEITILTATSGDTGKAALEGFHDVEGFKCVVYYPKNGVSAIQERQMNTQVGNNVKVIAIEGNFDDAQRSVKNIFADEELAMFCQLLQCRQRSVDHFIGYTVCHTDISRTAKAGCRYDKKVKLLCSCRKFCVISCRCFHQHVKCAFRLYTLKSHIFHGFIQQFTVSVIKCYICLYIQTVSYNQLE